MRILFIAASFPPLKCGVGDYTSSLVESLANFGGHEIAVITGKSSAFFCSGKSYVSFPIVRNWSIREIPAILRVVRSWKPDLIHWQFPARGYGNWNSPLQYILPSLLAFFYDCIHVQTWHEFHLIGSKRYLLNALQSGGIISVRPDFFDKFPRWLTFLFGRKRMKYIPSGPTIPVSQLTEASKTLLKKKYCSPDKQLITFFGFTYERKGLEILFDVVDPKKHHLLLITDLSDSDPYQNRILKLIDNERFQQNVSITGFLPPESVGDHLAASDAVILPFTDGGGDWNTSIHAASAQGTFVITASFFKSGYDSVSNIYYATVGNIPEIIAALGKFCGKKVNNPRNVWQSIAEQHSAFYGELF